MQIENRKDHTSILHSRTLMATWEAVHCSAARHNDLSLRLSLQSEYCLEFFDFNCIFGCFDHHNRKWRKLQNEFLFWERYCAVPSILRRHSNIWHRFICQSALLNFKCAVPAFLSRIHNFLFFSRCVGITKLLERLPKFLASKWYKPLNIW